jgi:branched-chain amino acid transport system substrate-binding protein
MSASRTEILAGLSLSLSGPFERQGREAHDGVRLWVEHVEHAGGLKVAPHGPRRPLRLIALDDASSAARAQDNVQRLLVEHQVDVLLGPYSSGLTLAVAPLAAAQGKLLWNHGGASDALLERGWRHVVSVPAPASAYFRDLPGLVKERDPRARLASIVYRSSGTFADAVRHGTQEAAHAAGFQVIRATPFHTPIQDARALLAEALTPTPDLLIGAGAFQDDVALARARAALATSGTVAFVAAGVDAFYDEVGAGAEGIVGPSQWEPAVYEHPAIGPASSWLCAEFLARFRYAPGYIAAQAYATGIVIAECIARAATLEDDALLRVAQGLETSTLYGGFRLDPESLRQIGHRILLVQWHGGRRVLLRR